MTDEVEPVFVKVGIAARRLGIGRKTLRDMVRRGDLPGCRLGPKLFMVRATALDALLAPAPRTPDPPAEEGGLR